MSLEIGLVAAVAEGGVIGRGGDLPWKLPRDLGHFRRLTTGHPILMGRRTWESIGVPLPGRTSIVISSQRKLALPEEVILVASLGEAVETARKLDAAAAFVIGGAAVYREALSLADRLFLTRVLASVEGDVHVPELEAQALSAEWKMVSDEPHAADERHAHPHAFEQWVRRGH